jgi:hypothetical protein
MDEVKEIVNEMAEMNNGSRRPRGAESLAVHIRQDGEVDNEVVNLSKSAGDEIVWHSSGDPFTVFFPVSPFREQNFHVPAGETVRSGPPRPDASIDRYQYFITNLVLAKSADPGVDIKP